MRRVSSLLFVTVSAVAARLRADDRRRKRAWCGHETIRGRSSQAWRSPRRARRCPACYTATTDAAGRYRLGDLPPGDYTIVGGARRVRAVHPDAGHDARGAQPRRRPRDEGGRGRRNGRSHRRTRRSSRPSARARRVNISGELLRGDPAARAARVVRRADAGARCHLVAGCSNNTRLFSVHGADAPANIVQVDGVDVAPSSAESSILHVGLSSEAIDGHPDQDLRRRRLSPARTGWHRQHRDCQRDEPASRSASTLSLQPRAWNDSNLPGGTSGDVAQRQADLSLGAPLAQGPAVGVRRLPLYGRRIRCEPHRRRCSRPSRRSSRTTRRATRTSTSQMWLAKLTAQLTASHQLAGFHQHDLNPTRTADVSGVGFTEDRVGGSAVSARLSSVWSDRLTTRLAASYNDKRREVPDPGITMPNQRVFESTILSGGRLAGTGLAVNIGSPILASTLQPNSKLTLSFDATLFVANHRSGSHELQAGLYAQPRLRIRPPQRLHQRRLHHGGSGAREAGGLSRRRAHVPSRSDGHPRRHERPRGGAGLRGLPAGRLAADAATDDQRGRARRRGVMVRPRVRRDVDAQHGGRSPLRDQLRPHPRRAQRRPGALGASCTIGRR